MEEVPEEHVDLYSVFEEAYAKFVKWVKANAHLLGDQDAIDKLVKAVDRDAALAIVVLQSLLADAEVRAAIAGKDLEFFRVRAAKKFDCSQIEFPDSVVANGFQFAEAFVSIIDEIQRE